MLKTRSPRTASLLLLCLGLAPAVVAAEEPQVNTPYVFETVDSFHITGTTTIEVTGILQGQGTARTFRFRNRGNLSFEFTPHVERCDRMALLAMSKPGAYLFTLAQPGDDFPILTCKLTRR